MMRKIIQYNTLRKRLESLEKFGAKPQTGRTSSKRFGEG